MDTYQFPVHMSGFVRIDAESESAAREEFERDFAHEAVLVTAQQDQIFVLSGMAWEEPSLFVDPDDQTQEEEEEHGEEV